MADLIHQGGGTNDSFWKRRLRSCRDKFKCYHMNGNLHWLSFETVQDVLCCHREYRRANNRQLNWTSVKSSNSCSRDIDVKVLKADSNEGVSRQKWLCWRNHCFSYSEFFSLSPYLRKQRSSDPTMMLLVIPRQANHLLASLLRRFK